MNCPYCDTLMVCDTVDIGVGEQQSGPYGCENCHAVQMGYEMHTPGARDEAYAKGEIDVDELLTGVYKGRK